MATDSVGPDDQDRTPTSAALSAGVVRRLGTSLKDRRVRIVIEATLLGMNDGDLVTPDSVIGPTEVLSVEEVTDAD